MVKMMKTSLPLRLMQDCVKFVTTRKLNAFFFPVVMPELVKTVPQELKILASHVLIVVNLFQQPTGSIYNHIVITSPDPPMTLVYLIHLFIQYFAYNNNKYFEQLTTWVISDNAVWLIVYLQGCEGKHFKQ